MRPSKKLALTAAALVSLSVITSSYAVCSLGKGFYAGAGGGYSQNNGKSYPGSTNTSGLSYTADGGYKFTRYIAVEGGYTRYAPTRIKNSEGITAARDNHYSVDLTSKLIFPFGMTGIEAFGKLGVALINSSIGSVDTTASAVDGMTFDTSTQHSVGLYWGGGVQYYFDANFAADLQVAQARGNSNTGNLTFYSVGLSALF